MVRIVVNNTALDIGNVSISFDLRNPIFNTIGSFSYPFNLPNTPKNRAVLGFPHKLHYAGAVNKSHQADIYIAGLHWKQGVIIVRDANKDHIKVNFGVGEGYFYNVIKDLKLNEVDLGGNRTPDSYEGSGTNDQWSIAYTGKFPELDFTVFDINGTIPDLPDDFVINLKYNGFDPTYKMNLEAIPNLTKFNVIVPFVYLNFIINQFQIHFNISTFHNSFLLDDELRQLVLLNNKSINTYQFKNNSHSLIVNRGFDLKNHVGEYSFLDLFSSLQNTFFSVVFYDPNLNSFSLRFFKDILFSNSIELETKFYRNNISNHIENGYKLSYDKYWGNSNKASSITHLNFIDSVNDYDDLPQSGNFLYDCFYVTNQSSYFVWINSNYFGTFQNMWVSIGDEKEFENGERTISLVTKRFEKLPVSVDNLPEQKFYPNPDSILFYFFRGMINTPYNYSAPIGGFRSHSSEHTDIFNHSLNWHGDTGIYEKFWKVPLDFFRTTRTAEYLMPLTAAQLKQIDFSKKYRWDQADWLIDRITFTVTNNKISPAKITVRKCQQ